MAAPSLSDAQWQVMQVLWDQSPLSATEVVARLAKSTSWSPRTVKTMLSRLVSKGALTYTPQGHLYLYRPAVTRAACIRVASRSFLHRVFAGDHSNMLSHLVKQSRLSPAELAQLKAILEEKGH